MQRGGSASSATAPATAHRSRSSQVRMQAQHLADTALSAGCLGCQFCFCKAGGGALCCVITCTEVAWCSLFPFSAFLKLLSLELGVAGGENRLEGDGVTCSSILQVQVVAGNAFSIPKHDVPAQPNATLCTLSAAASPAGVQLVREGNQAGEKEEEEDIHGGIQNGQLFPPLPAVPLPECSAGCARAQPLEVIKQECCS